MIPLMLKLKKNAHKEIAKAQDVIVEELYAVFNNAALHGGTAIWRCYGGNRFSEDIDAYIPKNKEKILELFENFQKKGFAVEKKKITENSVYSNLKLNRTHVRFEATFQQKIGMLKDYERTDGTFIAVYILSAEELIKEKVSAYLNRRKIRDLYDVFFLLKHAGDKEDIGASIKQLAREFKTPIDKEELKVLLIEGLVPSPEKMLEYIKNHVS